MMKSNTPLCAFIKIKNNKRNLNAYSMSRFTADKTNDMYKKG